MKKLISAALCGIMLAAALVGCGGSSSQKTYNLDDVVAAVEKVNEVANPLAMDDFAIGSLCVIVFAIHLNQAGSCP